MTNSTPARPTASVPGRTGNRGQRLIAVAALVVLAAVAALAAVQYLSPPDRRATPAANQGSGTAAIGGPFQLVDQNGRTVTDADFRGRFMLVYFGYIYCPDICPTSLQRMSEAIEALGPAGEMIVPIFITVDPERDTVAEMKGYAAAFHPRLVALTGTRDQVNGAVKAYRVYFAKVGEKEDPQNYLVDHSAFLYLMGPDGHFLTHFSHAVDAATLADRLRLTLAEVRR